VAEILRNEPGFEVELIDGGHGEFTVAVDRQTVVRKSDAMPSVEEVVSAVKKANPVPVG